MPIVTLIDTKARLNKDVAGSHIRFPFYLDKPAKELRLEFSFTPDIMEDKEAARTIIRGAFLKYTGEVEEHKVDNYLPLKNLLTLSVDSPRGFLGTAHRHMPKQTIFINKGKASRGFIPSEI